jgi:holo-[acyl-carrier protein] synthase
MIYGIGVDLVKIARIERILSRWGERFVGRVYTEGEAEICYKRVLPASSFALRFAAKEAFSKALGTGMRQGVQWRDIEVEHAGGGRPVLKLHGKCFQLCQARNITGHHVSLSDEGDYGVAVVVLEKEA